MNTRPAGRCQSAPGIRSGGAFRPRWVLLSACLTLLARTAIADDGTPPWQRDLDAAHTLQLKLTVTPAADPAADTARRQQLSQLYTQLVVRYAAQVEVQRAAAVYYDETGERDRALFCWQHAAALDPRDAPTADALGQEWLQRGRTREACAQFERAVDDQPGVAAYHADLANVLYLFRQELLAPPARPDEQAVLREALAHFRRAAELSPTDLNLARAYAETFYIFAHPDWEQALAAWQAVLSLSGTDTDYANGHLARVSLRLGRPDDVETYLGRIRSPGFDALKVKFRQQAAAMRKPTVPAPVLPAAAAH